MRYDCTRYMQVDHNFTYAVFALMSSIHSMNSTGVHAYADLVRHYDNACEEPLAVGLRLSYFSLI